MLTSRLDLCALEAADPDLPLAGLIRAGSLASQAVARHPGLTGQGLPGAAHWKGVPMHYWADRAPGS